MALRGKNLDIRGDGTPEDADRVRSLVKAWKSYQRKDHGDDAPPIRLVIGGDAAAEENAYHSIVSLPDGEYDFTKGGPWNAPEKKEG